MQTSEPNPCSEGFLAYSIFSSSSSESISSAGVSAADFSYSPIVIVPHFNNDDPSDVNTMFFTVAASVIRTDCPSGTANTATAPAVFPYGAAAPLTVTFLLSVKLSEYTPGATAIVLPSAAASIASSRDL